MGTISLSPNRQFITLTGTAQSDQIQITHQANGQLQVRVNEQSQSFPADQIRGVMVHALAGADRIEYSHQAPKGALPTYNLFAEAGPGDDTLIGPGQNQSQLENVLRGNEGNDVIIAGDAYNLIEGGTGDDILIGGSLDDRIHGNAGHDKLYGRGGDDQLEGWEGDDLLVGGSGQDRLYGGTTWFDAGQNILIQDEQ